MTRILGFVVIVLCVALFLVGIYFGMEWSTWPS